MPVKIGEGPSPTAYPNCRVLDFETGLEVCGKNEIGWLIWSWGMMSNGDCKPNFDVTTNGKFGNWETQYSQIMVVGHPYSLMRTAEKPASFYPGSTVKVTGIQLLSNSTNLLVGDSAKLDVVVAPANAQNKDFSLLILQSKNVLSFSADSSHVIAKAEGTAVVRAMHAATDSRETLTFRVAKPVSAKNTSLGENTVKLFPNPAGASIRFELPRQGDIEVIVTDAKGAIVDSISEVGSFTLNLEDYRKGIYFAKTHYLGDVAVHKFVKE